MSGQALVTAGAREGGRGAPPPPCPPYGPPQPVPGAYPPPQVGQPLPPRPNRYRSSGEMAYLFGVGIVYGVGSGVWIDSIGHITDPGIAFIPPLALGAGVPIG